MQTAIPTREQRLDALYAIGHELFERDELARAADVFRYLAVAAPERAAAWWGLAACHERLEDYEVAAALYKTGAELSGELELGLLAARAWSLAGDTRTARDVLEDVVDVNAPAELRARAQFLQAELERRAS